MIVTVLSVLLTAVLLEFAKKLLLWDQTQPMDVSLATQSIENTYLIFHFRQLGSGCLSALSIEYWCRWFEKKIYLWRWRYWEWP